MISSCDRKSTKRFELTFFIFITALCHLDDDLAFAEDGGQQQGEIQVVFEDDNDKAAKKARENEAMKKRQQNAVPSWHAWSTVSGEMTALGAEAAKRLDLPMDDTKAEGEAEVDERDSAREECELIDIFCLMLCFSLLLDHTYRTLSTH